MGVLLASGVFGAGKAATQEHLHDGLWAQGTRPAAKSTAARRAFEETAGRLRCMKPAEPSRAPHSPASINTILSSAARAASPS